MNTLPATAEVKITPALLAEIFWNMDGDEQAQFFNALGSLALGTPAPFSGEIGSFFGLDMQMCCAVASDYSLPLGRQVMEIIGQQASGTRMQPYREQFQLDRQTVKKGIQSTTP